MLLETKKILRLVKPHKHRREVRPIPKINTVTHGKWFASVSVRTKSKIFLFFWIRVILIVAGSSLCFSQSVSYRQGAACVGFSHEYARRKGHAHWQCHDQSQSTDTFFLPSSPLTIRLIRYNKQKVALKRLAESCHPGRCA